MASSTVTSLGFPPVQTSAKAFSAIILKSSSFTPSSFNPEGIPTAFYNFLMAAIAAFAPSSSVKSDTPIPMALATFLSLLAQAGILNFST